MASSIEAVRGTKDVLPQEIRRTDGAEGCRRFRLSGGSVPDF